MAVSKADYIQILRRHMEQQMNDTVSLLRSTAFFADWTAASISRLFFWFERKRYAATDDVVKQGDDANFCFII